MAIDRISIGKVSGLQSALNIISNANSIEIVDRVSADNILSNAIATLSALVSNQGSAIVTNSADTTSLKNRVSANSALVSQIVSVIESNSADVTSLKNRVSANSALISTVALALSARIDTVSNALSAFVLNSLADVSTNGATDGQALMWNSVQSQWVASTLATGTNSVTSNEVSVNIGVETSNRISADNSLSVRIDTVSNNLSQNSVVLSNAVSAIVANSAQMSLIASALSQQISVLSVVVSNEISARNALSVIVSNAQSAITTNSADVTSLKNRVSANSAVVSNLQSAVITNSAQMTSADNAISNAISILSVIVSNQASAIVTNSADVTSLKNRVSALSTDLTSFKVSLNNFGDVSTSSPSDGQVLMYNASAGQWFNSTVPTGSGSVTSQEVSLAIAVETSNRISADNALSNSISVLSANVVTISLNVSAISTRLDTVSNNLSANSVVLSNTISAVVANSADVTSLKNRVSGISADLTSFKASLNNFTDVSILTPVDQQFLVWNSVQAQWVNSTINAVASVTSQEMSVAIGVETSNRVSADNALSNLISALSVQLSLQVSALSQVHSALSANVVTISLNLSALSTRADVISNNLSQNSVVLSNAVSAIVANSADVTSLKNLVSALSAIGEIHAVRLVQTTNVTPLTSVTSVIDGISAATGDRVLLAGQTSLQFNGIYTWSPGGYTRTTDMNNTSVWNKQVPGRVLQVNEGTANAGKFYVVSAAFGGTIDTTSIIINGPYTNIDAASAVNAVSNAISALSVQLSLQVSALSQVHSALSANVATISLNVSAISTRLSALSSQVTGVSAQMTSANNAISNAVSIVSVAQAATSAAVTSVNQVVSVLSNAVSVLSQNVSVISVKMDTISNAISVVSAANVSIAQQVSVLSQAVSVLSVNVNTISNAVSIVSVAQANTSAAVTSVNNRVSAISADVTSIQSVLSAISVKFVSVNSAISVNSAQMTSADNAISNAVSIVSVAQAATSAAVTSVNQVISVISQQVSVLSVRVASNSADFTSFKASIDNFGDVSLTSLADGMVIMWRSASAQWVASAVAVGTGSVTSQEVSVAVGVETSNRVSADNALSNLISALSAQLSVQVSAISTVLSNRTSAIVANSAQMTSADNALSVLASQRKTYATLVVGAVDALDTTTTHYDYVCDGTADEVQILAAISALPATGGKILLSEGQFNIAAAIVINKNNVVLEGQGQGTKIFLANATNTNMITVGSGATAYTNITVRNMYLDGNRTNQTTNGHGIEILAAPLNTKIENCRIYNTLKDNINTGGGNIGAKIINNYLDTTGSTYSNIHSSGSNCIISGNYCASGGNYNIYADGSAHPSGNIISNNTCTLSGGEGIFAASWQIVISGNHVSEFAWEGITVTTPANIVGNSVYQRNGVGNIGIYLSASDPQHCAGNTIFVYDNVNFIFTGIYCQTASSTITGNDIQFESTTTPAHIGISIRADKMAVTGNTITQYQFTGTGITRGASGSWCTISGNMITGFATGINITSMLYSTCNGNTVNCNDGIVATDSTHCIIADNNIYVNTASGTQKGIYVNNGSTNVITITGNAIYRSALEGIYLAKITKSIISNNKIYNGSQAASSAGILLTGTCTYNTITGNTVHASGNVYSYGIREASSADGPNVIANNVVLNWTTAGIGNQHASTQLGLNITS